VLEGTCSGSPGTANGDPEDEKSIVSEAGDVGQDANCTHDLAAPTERKRAESYADDPTKTISHTY
jgi:hypothetical protein